MDQAPRTTPPHTLLLHDGELADVRGLLGDLGAPFIERRGSLLGEDRETSWGLVVATPQRILDAHFEGGSARPTQIVIYDRGSRTLRNSLRRAGIQLMVRRPVHPAALRALVLHALYRGPEKRRNTRVSIGAPVRFRSGWRMRPAVLADLSLGGCRLLSPLAAEPGRAITVRVPADVADGRAFQVRARVLRRLGEGGPEPAFSAKFEKLKPKQVEGIRRTIALHARGPATIDTATSKRAQALEADASLPGSGAAAAPAEVRPQETTTTLQAGVERRSHLRHDMNRRVIALGEEATRVLMGRDISVGGMRVNPNPLLNVGQDIRLAIHVGDRDLPLIVVAKVHRDDGERGMVLRFHRLEPATNQMLNRMIEELPMTGSDESEQDVGMIVSEILESAPEATSL